MKLIILALLLCHLPARAESRISIFGTELTFRASSPKDEASLNRLLGDVKANTQSFDPDCYYAPKEGACPVAKPHALSKGLDALAESLKAETSGNFDVLRTAGDKKKRDYGGLIQGYVIDEMKKVATAPIAVNFAGDVFVSPQYKNFPSLSVEDALVKGMKFAIVSMTSGWMLGSSSPLGGSAIVDPKTGSLVEKPDFHKVVLFAKPEFSGARLDA